MPFINKRSTRPTRLAKALRNSATDAERRLWLNLQSSQLEGVKFRRQEPIKEYIVEFVSFQKKLIIELDGGQHAEAMEKDMQRDDCLVGLGFKVLRFWNNDVFQNLEGVLEVIRQHCKD
jgi:very-short-patch-repair endonuclease